MLTNVVAVFPLSNFSYQKNDDDLGGRARPCRRFIVLKVLRVLRAQKALSMKELDGLW